VCGKNKYGQLGVGGGATESKSPVRVEGIPPVSHVDCGGAHTAAVTASGEVYTWGLGGQWWSWTLGGLGHGDRNSQAMPKQVAALEGIRVVKVACGKMHTLALTSEGSVYAWGEGQYGRLGLSSNSSRAVPTMIYQEVFGNEKVVDVQSGAYHGIALTESGKVYVWGRNHYGQIGSNSNNIDYFAVETTPFIPDNLNDLVIKSISASDQLSVAVTGMFFFSRKSLILNGLNV
jgi:E3 ubiquitin-protein ligase HERC2